MEQPATAMEIGAIGEAKDETPEEGAWPAEEEGEWPDYDELLNYVGGKRKNGKDIC